LAGANLIILNGPMGVGKTTTARALMDRLLPALFLDGDHVADFQPFDVRRAEDLDYLEDTLVHMASFHAANGFQRQIIVGVFETPERLGRFHARLRDQGHEVVCFRLTCEPREHERRVRARNRDNLHWELRRHRELARVLNEGAARGDLGRAVDTTGLSPEEVADQIMEQLPSYASARYLQG
jgi:predicted kinase